VLEAIADDSELANCQLNLYRQAHLVNAALGHGCSFTIKNLLTRFGVGWNRAGDIREPIAAPDSVWMDTISKPNH
jgi:hypothetical protein